MIEKLPSRNEVDPALTWRLEDIYPDEAAFEAELSLAGELAEKIAACEGHVTDNAAALLKVYDLYAECMERVYSFSSYASMKHDEDQGNSAGQVLFQKAQAAEVRIGETLAFLEPEILTLSPEKLEEFYRQEPGLLKYEVSFKEMFRQKEHSLSPELERLLASAGEVTAVPYNTYSFLSNADLKFPAVTDSEGKTVQITGGRFVPLEMSPDRALRKEVFEKYYERYKEFVNTWAGLYDGQVKQQLFYAKARRYASSFEAAVDANHVSPSVCDRLIERTREGLPVMHRYVSLRKKLLGVDELHMYDVYAPMVKDFSMSVTYEEAKEISLKALAPLGEDYLALLKEGYENRWIDVVENEGKRGGAYSSGVYAVHPYVLLNFNGTLDDIFTLVHEMGHSLHTWYSCKNQSFLNSNYTIFVAEVASTTNEILLLEYLLSKASSREEKAYLINHYLENFKGTLFRQVMFEEFERKTNQMHADGIPLTAEALCETYLKLNREYFGPDMVSDDLIAYEWCRIPHFYYNFYVYQYATSFSASVAIAHRILEGVPGALESYRAFLKSGCTDDPVSLLKLAGIDMSEGTPVTEAIGVFEQAVADMEKLFEQE